MAKIRILKGTLAAAAVVLMLTGCGYRPPAPPTAEKPMSAKAAGFDVYYTELKAQHITVTCFEDGSGKNRVLSCFKGAQDVPKDKIVDLKKIGFSLSYVDAGQGTTVACFEDGSGKSRVMSCFPFEDKKDVAPKR